ncbi:MAG: DUF1156 domain-containing protein [Synergistaceae bacterium]|nr:DUF1156 domain-containing protein [Synergistaceae bacterium]
MNARKLIEVALPLETINTESSREKSIRHGHPSTLHLWWSRKPLTTTRAVIWASLVDDPSSHPEKFPDEASQNAERERLFGILRKLVVWENSNNPQLLAQAKAEILSSTHNNPPELLDPFAGGGSIPLEGQRLGLHVHARDLNPIAVTLNKAMTEIPPRFSGIAPVNPEVRRNIGGDTGWEGASALAEDVRYYGGRMKSEAFGRIGRLYPKVHTEEGSASVIAWIWARTVRCPNPACGCDMPLVNSFVLSKKKGREAFVEPVIEDGTIRYEVRQGRTTREGTVTRSGATCPVCGGHVELDHIRGEGRAHRLGARMIAVVAEGEKGRLYLTPTREHEEAADVPLPDDYPDTNLPEQALGFRVQLYGMVKHKDLFTPRQLTMLTTFSGIIRELRDEVMNDALRAGMAGDSQGLAEGGRGARAYAEAVSVYLAFVLDKMASYHSSFCTWLPPRETMGQTFGRQAIPMVWDYAEGNPFSDSSGCFDNTLAWVVEALNELPAGPSGEASQSDAQAMRGLQNVMISTDPPYYDNIGYADLSDYFYIWMRRSLKDIYPALFRTMLVPKAEELIATPYRHEGSPSKAKKFFEEGMLNVCRNLWQCSRDDVPVTVYYAYKQSDNDTDAEGQAASSGWETMLNAIIRSGFAITGTWPMRTERPTALKSAVNALASSIVLVCRKRPEDAPSTTKRSFLAELKRELHPALEKLQSSNIAPVDMPQSAIGPGMAVFSKYSAVLEPDGRALTIRDALKIINQELDAYFNEQDGELDSESRFCVEVYMQRAFDTMKFGDADNMARAKNISVANLAAKGIVFAQKGSVHLTDREELAKTTGNDGITWVVAQKLTHAMETGGFEACANIVVSLGGSGSAERAKALAYRLYTVAERRKWTREAFAYNSLVISWPAIMERARTMKHSPEQLGITFSEGE